MRRRIAVALVILASAAVVNAEQAPRATTEVRTAVVLRLSTDDQQVVATALLGEAIRFENLERKVRLEVVPSLEAGDPSAQRIVLEAYEVTGDTQQPNLVESVQLPSSGAVFVFGERLPLVAVELIEVREVKVPPSELRPRECCISCGADIWCGFCVEAPCGSCCLF
jgi:hypothetical protein